MRHKPGLVVLVLLSFLLQQACADREPTAAQQPSPFTRSFEASGGNANTLDAQFEQLTSEIPGFGGLFFDESGRLNIFLTDPTARDRAIPILENFFRGRVVSLRRGQLDVASLVVHPGKFDFRHLAEWRRMLNQEVFTLPGVRSTDIDESRNRIVLSG